MKLAEDLKKMLPSAGSGRRPDWLYAGPADYVLANGRFGAGGDLSESAARVMADCIGAADIRPRQCFANAQALATVAFEAGAVYVEGYARRADVPIPILHAWVEVEGVVIDPTWIEEHRRGSNLGVLPEGWEYLGVPFDTMTIVRRIEALGEGSSLIDDWKRGWPLLRSGGRAA